MDTMEYPYYKNYFDLSAIRSHFNKLKEYEPEITKNNDTNKYFAKLLFIIKLNYGREEIFNRLTDYFSEECRVRCNVKNTVSPLYHFNDNREIIIKNLGKNPTYSQIDSYLYKFGAKPCTNFSLIVCLTVLNYLKPTNWLDPSAGWGDRLISAIAYGKCDYTGVDPSECMHPKYKEIVDTLGATSDKKYTLIKGGFEDVDIAKDSFDLVFTSPPFFDLEDYGKDEGQSMLKFKTFKEWKDGFMYPFLQKSINALKSKGHMALYVNDYSDKKTKTRYEYVGDIIAFMKTEQRMHFLGTIVWVGDSYPKTIIIYKKI